MFLLCELKVHQVTDAYRRHLMHVRGGRDGSGLVSSQVEVADGTPFVQARLSRMTVVYAPHGDVATALVRFADGGADVAISLAGGLLVLPCPVYRLELRSTVTQVIQLSQLEGSA